MSSQPAPIDPIEAMQVEIAEREQAAVLNDCD
jgi:hypothetical protein